MQFTLTIEASPPLLSTIGSIALALNNLQTISAQTMLTQPTGKTAMVTEEFSPALNIAASQANAGWLNTPFDGTDVTLEEVRAKAALLSQAGKKQAIRNLMAQHSAASISALTVSDPDDFLN